MNRRLCPSAGCLPIAIGIARGQRHEVRLVQDPLRARFVRVLPTRLIGDRAYDSDKLDTELAELGVEMIAPHHPNRKRNTQDGRPRLRYQRRWNVERLFSWLSNFRRLVTRYENHADNFLGLVKLGCIVILLRRL